MLTPNLILSVFAAISALAATSVRRIPEGHAYTLRRLGGRMRTVGAGIHLMMPLVERVAHKINLLGNVVEVSVPSSHANASPLRAYVYFQVMDAQRADPV